MKKFLIKSAALAALTVISAVSCTKEQNVDASVSQPELHFIIKTAENTPVKSFIEKNNLDGTYTPKWTKDDKLALFIGEITTSTTEPTAILSNKAETGTTATFDETVPTDQTEGSFISFSPAGAFEKGYTDGTVGINLSKIQSPSSLTIDEACDVLVAKPCDFTAKNGTVAINDLYFKRIFSIVKVNLKGVAALNGEKVTSFTLSAPTTLTGLTAVDLSTASISQWNTKNESVVANYTKDNPVFGGEEGLENTVWLVVNPTTVASGSVVTFSGETDNYTFSKKVTLLKDLVFPQSQMAVINLTIGEGNYTAKTVEKTWTWTAASGDLGTQTPYSATLNKKAWSVTRSSVIYTGSSDNCIQLGSRSGAETVTLTSNAFSGTIKKVAVECSSYKGAHKVDITVGGTSYKSGVSTAKWTTVGTVTGTGTSSGEIVIKFTAGSRALYIKSISVTYAASGSTGGGETGGGETGGGETGGGESGGGEGGTTKYYKKVSSITSGNSYLIVGGGTSPAKIMKHPTTTAATVGFVQAQVSNNQISSSTDVDACVVTITKNGDYYTIAFDSNYISAGGSNTDLKIATTPPSSRSTDNANWVISTVTSYGSFQIKNSKQDTRAILWRSGTINKFGNYKASNANGTEYYNIDLYELAN